MPDKAAGPLARGRPGGRVVSGYFTLPLLLQQPGGVHGSAGFVRRGQSRPMGRHGRIRAAEIRPLECVRRADGPGRGPEPDRRAGQRQHRRQVSALPDLWKKETYGHTRVDVMNPDGSVLYSTTNSELLDITFVSAGIIYRAPRGAGSKSGGMSANGWFTPSGHANNGIGGFGTGMSLFGGTFRVSNSSGFSPKFYKISNITGRGWGGGGRGHIRTYSASGWGKGIGYGSLAVSLVLGGIYVTDAWQQDGNIYGGSTQMAVAQTSLGIAGAFAGAEIGASLGLFFGGVGAISGAVIGGFIGGIAGGIGGSELGEAYYNWFKK
jgi:hypothetical protein